MTAAVVFLGGVSYSVDTPDSAEGTTVTVATPAPPRGPLVVVGDSYSMLRPDEGTTWPQLVAQRTGLELVDLAVGGSGYVRGLYDSTFPSAVAGGLPADAAVVLVFGGLNDRWDAEPAVNVRQAARTTFAMVRRLAPAAVLIVAGPQCETGTPPAITLQHRDVVRAEALAAGAVWVDPLDPPWMAGPGLIGWDGLHPSIPAGHAAIADRLTPYVSDALTR